MTQFKLIRIDQTESVPVVLLTGEPLIVGRSVINGVSFPDITNMSRQHAEFLFQNGKPWIRDLSSKNGTFVNGVKVQETELRVGDIIRVGSLELELVYDEIVSEATESRHNNSEQTKMFNIHELLGKSNREEKSLSGEMAFRLLYRVSTELIKAQESEAILSLAGNLIREVVQADYVYYMLKPGSDFPKTFICDQCAWEFNELHERFPASKTLLKKVMQRKVALLATDTTLDPAFKDADSIVFSGIYSLIAAPMLLDDRLLGIVAADSRTLGKHFYKSHLELLTAVANLLALRLEQTRLQEHIEQENRIRQRLAQFHSPQIVDIIIEKGGDLTPEEREATVWFCDLHGFTSFSESYSPVTVEKRLSAFYELAVESVFRYGGTLDKYLGDGFLAVFGAPFASEDDPIRAINAAIELHGKIRKHNQGLSESHRLEIRSGIATGKVIAGDIGTSVRRDYTIIGDTVNIARRLQEDVAKIGDIIVDRQTADNLKSLFKLVSLGEIVLRGKQKPSECFKVDHEYLIL
ncbi:FHA domain-containing protein [bacterium]|nr:FHA domain-containing protein [candidate division CSSED10-310 bacterium]